VEDSQKKKLNNFKNIMAWWYAKITIKSANSSEEEINTAVYTMKKKTLLYIASAWKVNNYGANGNRIWQVGRPCTYKDDNCLRLQETLRAGFGRFTITRRIFIQFLSNFLQI
jgi:hypothetical protein